MSGFRPKIKTDLIRYNPTTMEELKTQACLAELAQSLEPKSIQNATNATLCAAVNTLEERMQSPEMSTDNMVAKHQYQESRHRPHQRQTKQYQEYNQMPAQYHQRNNQHPQMQNRMTRASMSHPNQTQNARQECIRCGESCDSYYNCRARNQICLVCNKPNHLWMCCYRLCHDLKTGKVT